MDDIVYEGQSRSLGKKLNSSNWEQMLYVVEPGFNFCEKQKEQTMHLFQLSPSFDVFDCHVLHWAPVW